MAQMFFCEFCEISKSAISTEHLCWLLLYVPIWIKYKLTKAYSPCKIWTGFRSSRSQIFFKIGVLQVYANSTGKLQCWRHFSRKLQPWKLYLQEISTQVFSCEIWKIFKNTIFYRTFSVAAFDVTGIFKGFRNKNRCNFQR